MGKAVLQLVGWSMLASVAAVLWTVVLLGVVIFRREQGWRWWWRATKTALSWLR